MESHGAEERIYVLHDANYNVTALVDTSGEVLERYYYEAYGRAVYLDDAFALLPDAQSQFGWQHLHQGGRLDTITGNYHFRHRDLSPTLGRWISQDPIGFEAGDANLYRYVGNGPTTGLDPQGLRLYPTYKPGVNPVTGLGEETAPTREESLGCLKDRLRSQCETAAGLEEVDRIIHGLKLAIKEIDKQGGPQRLSYFGPVCTDCQDIVNDSYPKLPATPPFPAEFTYEPKVKEKGIDHVWGEIIHKKSGQKTTIDMWAKGPHDFWREGENGFGWIAD